MKRPLHDAAGNGSPTSRASGWRGFHQHLWRVRPPRGGRDIKRSTICVVPLIGAKEAVTLPGLFLQRLMRSPDRRAYLEYEPNRATWREITWRGIGERIERFRAALQALDLGKGDRVALLLPNGPDWVAFDLAALSLGLVVTPIYVRDSAFNIARILAHSGARVLLLDTHDRWAAIVSSGGSAPAVEHVWVANAAPSNLQAPLSALKDVLPGRGSPLTPVEAMGGDVATLVYTSGSSGPPKGVMLTHTAILWNAESVGRLITPTADDLFLSILPLAHAFERTVGYYLPMMAGAAVAYARSAETFEADLQALRPSVVLGVPLLYERLWAAIRDRAGRSGVRRVLLALATRLARRRVEQGDGSMAGAIDRLVRPVLDALAKRSLAAAFPRLRAAVSGGARLPEDVARFLVTLGLPLVEGYGLTEAAPVVTGSSVEDYLPGSVGRALPGAQLRISAEGELQVRSPGVMLGYWRDPEATAAAMQDGWLRTGDLAEIRNGRVFIRGRLADRVALATGEKFDPDLVEAAILREPLVEHACVLGDARPFAVAVLSLDRARWREFAKDQGLDPAEPNAPAARTKIMHRVTSQLRQFPACSQVRNVLLVLEPWTVEQGILTPTLKVKRRAVIARYEAAIAGLYLHGSA